LPLRLDDARELNAKAAEAARLLTALANRHRLAILCALVEGERSVGALGIVTTQRDAQTVYYRLASAAAGY
jgi:hypothetical protein